jgi:hypothetical protein
MLGTVLVLGACSDDPAGPTGDPLSREEALFIAGEVLASGEMTTDVPEEANSQFAIGMVPRSISQDLQITHPCPAGGQVALNWSADVNWDDETGDLTLDVEGSQEHLACAFTRENVTFTVHGDPDISLDAHLEIDDHQPVGEHTLNLRGGFRWHSSDDREGTCPISVEAITNWATQTRTIEGNICGHTVNETLQWS